MKKYSALSFFVVAFLIFSQTTHAVFTDISTSHPYFDAINYLQESGTVEGYEDGSYRPDQKVNRAEALKIILLGSKVLVPEIQEQEIFPDVLHSTWYGKYVAKGKNLSIVSGDDDTGMFRPGDTVNLAEILKILLETNNIELRSEDDMERRPYADVPTEAWFAPYFDYADSMTLLDEDDDYNVFPATPVTRGLMAQLMYQLQMKPEGYQEGEASYYGEKFHGKGTASGEVFDASEFTAAHRTLPFGTWLRVRNLANNMETYVRVNDRGPYAGENRIIDLSKAAFESIASLSSGVINVSITPVSGPPGGSSDLQAAADCPGRPSSKTYSNSGFENITLTASLQNSYLADEVFFLEGTSASSNKQVSAFLTDEGDNQFPFYATAGDGGSFSMPIYFPEPGDYQIGVLPGESGSSVVESITLLPGSCLNHNEDASLPAPTNLALSVSEGNMIIKWNKDASHDVSKITFTQGPRTKNYLMRGKTELTPLYSDFEGWSTGDTQVQISTANLEGTSFLDEGVVAWSPPLSTSFKAETHHQYIVDGEKAKVISLPSSLESGSQLTFKVDPKEHLDQWGRVILPSGLVEDVLLESPTHSPIDGALGIKIYPASAGDVRMRFVPKSNSIHFFEINTEQGIAAVNIPVYPKNSYPLIPSPVDLADLKPVALSSDLGALQNQMLQMVNADRSAHGLGPVSLDSNLTQLAQAKSEDMTERDYFGHWNPEGMTSNDLRKNYAIAQYVSENIARDVSVSLAQYGLMRSASHRSNILNDEWKRVGFGFSQLAEGGTMFVQIFSDEPINFSDVSGLRTEIIAELNAKRASAITLHDNLSSISQTWSDKWVNEAWCDINDDSCNPLTAPDITFTDSLRDGGINDTLGAYYRGDSSFKSAKDAILENASLQDSRWKNIGLGITQDSFGIIHFFITYTE